VRRRLILSTGAIALAAVLILGVPLGIVETRRARSDAAARLEREADAVAAAVDDRVERGQRIAPSDIAALVRHGHRVVVVAPDGTRTVAGARLGRDVLSQRSGAAQRARITASEPRSEVDERVRNVWLLIAASIPFTAVVFVFGGVAPEDLVRGYTVLVVTALGFGAFGLFCSSIVKRTQAATAITIFGVLTLSIGTLFMIVFWQALATPTDAFGRGGQVTGAAPGPITYLNPFLAQAEITPTEALCASDNSLRYYCRFRETFVTNPSGVIFVNGTDNSGGGVVIKGGVAVPVAVPPQNLIGGGGVLVPESLGRVPLVGHEP